MSITYRKKTSPLLLLLFLSILACSIFISKAGLNKTDTAQKTEDKSQENSKSIESIEIYKVDTNKESSIIDHWYFRDSESLETIKSILKKECEKTTTVPPVKAEYKIILSYNNSEIEVYPLWIEDNSDNAIFENEKYNLISTSGTAKLKALMISP